MERSAPDFFIIGAPKCGTTALYTYLRRHPQIFMPEKKEPHFYATDFANYRSVRDRRTYLRLFQVARSDQLCGEASVWYLYSKNAVQNILNDNPNAKFIVMLRNPLEAIPALHDQKLASLDENVASLHQAWELIADRKKGRQLPPGCREPSHLFYDDVFSYGEQLERLERLADRRNIHYICFEDFSTNTLKVYSETLEHLGVVNDGQNFFERVNERYTLKNRRVAELVRMFGRTSLYIAGRYIAQQINIHPLRWINAFNQVRKNRQILSEELAQKIQQALEEDLRMTKAISGIDLLPREKCER